MKEYLELSPNMERMLSAYLEGSLSPDEVARVEQLIASNEELSEVIDIVNEVDDTIDVHASIYDDYPDFDQTFRLPELPDDVEPPTEEVEILSVDELIDDSEPDGGDWDVSVLDDMDIIDTDDFVDCM